MTRGFKILALGFVFLTAMSGCTSMTGETLGQNIDDTNITTAVKAKLAGERAVTLTRIGVDTVRGVVHLSGVVDNETERSRAAQLAAQVGGVKSVVNNLQLRGR